MRCLYTEVLGTIRDIFESQDLFVISPCRSTYLAPVKIVDGIAIRVEDAE